METALVVVHSTETDDGTGRTLSINMPKAGSEPHEIYDPSRNELFQLHPPGTHASKALMNLPGGVETNRREYDGRKGWDVFQVEIVARAAQVPFRDNQWYDNLRNYLIDVHVRTGVPYVFPLPFASSYANAPAVRLSFAQWRSPALVGFIGHCHVPEQTHWDPGRLDLSRLSPPLSPEVMMSAPVGHIDLKAAENGRVRVAGWAYDPDEPDRSIDVHFHVFDSGVLRNTVLRADQQRPDVNAAFSIVGDHGFSGLIDPPALPRPVTTIMYAMGTDGVPAEIERGPINI